MNDTEQITDHASELSAALSALLWQWDHEQTLCGMALQDARAAITHYQDSQS